jgi:ABC-2 type transport system ATP-binding protein
MINIENVTKYYGHTRALHEVGFSVGKGEILGLLGPNGAGKTTLMRILTGYLRPTSGTVLLDGLDAIEHPLAAKARLGYLPEFAPLYQDMMVFDYLNYIAQLRSVANPEARIRELADMCGLEGVMHKLFRELSRGYKQRVGLAHALMADPPILVLDEPTSGLDPNQVSDIRRIVRELGAERTVVFSSHILSEVEAICDRVVIIHRGHVVADDQADRVKQVASPTVVITAEISGCSTDDAVARMRSVDGVQEAVPAEAPEGGVLLTLRCARDLRAQVYDSIKRTDWKLLTLRKETESLEAVFRELTEARS